MSLSSLPEGNYLDSTLKQAITTSSKSLKLLSLLDKQSMSLIERR
jgi:hypothetical protein